MATKISEATDLNSIQFQEQTAVGATPASTFGKLIGLDDGTLHYVNDAGTDTDLTASGTASEIALTNATELTIATGAVTKTQSYHSIDTEADAASDDLDTISGGTAGEVIYIFAVNDARDVVIKNGTGNILTYDGNDITLDEDHKVITLQYDGTNWRTVGVISAGGGGMTSFTLAGDSGGGQTISDANTLSVLGGTGITTVDSATDTVTANLDNTAVTPASYTYSSLTVDQQGRLTAASNGTTPAPVGATYIVQTADATLSAEQALGALATGIVKNTTTTGVLSIAAAGTDYTDASSTDTFTNKTIDANGTGNSISNIDVADLANGTDGELITWSATAVPATVAVGTATHVLTSNGVGAAPTFQAAAGGGVSVAIMQHTETSGTSGGGSSATTWNALQLDDEKDDPDNIVVIATDKFTPISGNYHLVATSTNFQISFARLRLYNVTGTAVVRQGTNARVATGQSQTVVVQAYFTANGTDEYRFDQWSAAAQATNGLGDAMTTGEEEVYVSVILTKI